jgi:hypothetical protein
MSAFDVHILTFPIDGGTHTGALGTIPVVGSSLLFKAPSDALGGGLTILEAAITSPAGGLGTFALLTSSSYGTKDINGTITDSFGTSSLGAGSAYAMTISDGFVDADEWVVLAKTGSIIYPGGYVSISYVMGK